MTDRRLEDAIETAFVDSDEPITLEQIYESVQAKISDKLTESDRRQIKDILHSHRQTGLIEKTSQGRYEVGFDIFKERGGLHGFCGTPRMIKEEPLRESVIYFISDRRGEAFALRKVYDSCRFSGDAIRNRYVIKEFIDELRREGLLESVGSQTYRATASFGAEPERKGSNAFADWINGLLKSGRRPGPWGLP